MHVMGVSVASGAEDGGRGAALMQRARSFGAVIGNVDAFLCATPGIELTATDSGGFADRRAPSFDEASGTRLDAAALARALASDTGAAALSLAAPAVVAGLDGAALRFASDRAGQGHLYVHIADGVAAVASSATLLARLFCLPPNTDALAAQALVGTPVHDDTHWMGVALAPLGAALRLQDGRLAELPFVPLPPSERAPLRDVVTALADAFPEAEIDLSGGWDTRLLLSALPADRRARHRALTLGHEGTPDVVVAQSIAKRFGMAHRILNPVEITGVDPDDFFAALAEVAVLDQFSLNPADRVLFHLLNRQEAGTTRFNGQNGEIVRGFYYPQQPVTATATPELAAKLVDWRIVANDRADPSLFRPDWWVPRAAAVKPRLVERILSMPGEAWGDKLDRLYLHERMRRWNGQSASSALASRRLLAPFFAQRFLDWAFDQPVERKTGARMPARLIELYEPALMHIPLDSGLTPAMVLNGGPEARIRKGMLFMKKASRKLLQRLSRRPAATLASGGTVGLFNRHALFRRVDVAAIDRLGVADPDRLQQFAEGRWTPDAPTLGMILNLHALAREVEGRSLVEA